MDNIKAVIFDFDDTLVDTRTFFARHIEKTLLGIYPPELHSELIKNAVQLKDSNIGFEDIFTETFGEKGTLVLEKYREDALETYYTPRDGMKELVSTLLKQGTTLYILSNRTNKLEERLEQAGFEKEEFRVYQAIEKKPSQLAYTEVLEDIEKRGVQKEEVLIYGNHPDDYLALPLEWRDRFIATPQSIDLYEAFQELSKEISSEITISKEFSKLS